MPIPVTDLVVRASEIFEIPAYDIVGPRRSLRFVRPRQAVCLAARVSGWSYRQIGRGMLGRDHRGIDRACGAAEVHYKRNPAFRRHCEALIDHGRQWERDNRHDVRCSIADYVEDLADLREWRAARAVDGAEYRHAATVLRSIASDIRAELDSPTRPGALMRRITGSKTFDGGDGVRVVTMLHCTLECGHTMEIVEPLHGRTKSLLWCEQCVPVC